MPNMRNSLDTFDRFSSAQLSTRKTKLRCEVPMQSEKLKLFLVFIFLSLFFLVCEKTNAQSLQWAKSLGGEGWDGGTSITVDPENGEVYTTGYVAGEIFISKLDSLGNFVWTKSIFGNGGTSHSIALDISGAEGVYITGTFFGTVDFDPGPDIFQLTSNGGGDIFISKYDDLGNFLWAKGMGGTDTEWDEGYSIAIDAAGSGNVYTTGVFWGIVDFDPGPGIFNLDGTGVGMFILKLDSAGNFVWAKSMHAQVYSITIDPAGSGGVYTTGRFSGTVDFDPGPGTFNLTGSVSMFISKLDSSGNFVWAKTMTGYAIGTSIVVDLSGTGDVYTTGRFGGITDFDPGPGTFNLISVDETWDIFVSKLDSAGSFVWAKSMGGQSDDGAHGIAVDTSGNVYTTGGFSSTVDFDPGAGIYNLGYGGMWNIFISKLDNSGNFVWAISSGEGYDDVGNSIAVEGEGFVHVTGYFQSPFIWFHCINLINYESLCYYENCECELPCYYTDLFIARIDGNGTPNVVTSTGDSGPGTLRDMIFCALSGDTITFALPPMSQIELTTYHIFIDKHLIISGPGISDLTISGNYTLDIFNIWYNANVSIENLSLKNAGGDGAAVSVRGDLTLENVLFQNNLGNGLPRAINTYANGEVTIKGNVEIKN